MSHSLTRRIEAAKQAAIDYMKRRYGNAACRPTRHDYVHPNPLWCDHDEACDD